MSYLMRYLRFSAVQIFFSCCFLLYCTLSGCKKEDPPAPPSPLTNREKILGTWTLSGTLEDVNVDGHFVNVLHACDLDDTWTFQANDTLYGSENGTTCGFFPPANRTYDWELRDLETVLYLHYPFFEDKYKIVTLNDTLLLINRPLDINDLNGRVYAKITYKR